jgi:hypothetical protein
MAMQQLSKSRATLSTAGFCAHPMQNRTTMLPKEWCRDVYVSPAACCSCAISIFFIGNSDRITRSDFFATKDTASVNGTLELLKMET